MNNQRLLKLIVAGIVFTALFLPPSVSTAGQNPAITLKKPDNPHRKPLSLRELIQLALKQNPGLKAVRKEIEVSGQGVLAARGERLGRIDFLASDFTYGTDNLPLVMNSLIVDQGKIIRDGIGAHNINLFSFGGRITVPIYTGGRITHQIELERLGKELADHRLEQTRDELIFNVASVYYNILKIQDFIQATQKSKERLLESRRVVRHRFSVGRVAKVDIFKVNTRLAAVEQFLIRFLNAREVLQGLLGVLLGENAEIPGATVSGDLTTLSRQPVREFSLQEIRQEALRRRPEWLAALKELKMQEKKIRIRYAEHLPDISLRGEIKGITGENSSLFVQPFAGIFLSVPVFSGGTIEANVNKERLRYARLQHELLQLKLRVNQEVLAAYLNAREAQHRIAAAQAALEEAGEVLRIEALKVREGKSIIENLLDAQTAQLQAEQNFSAAVADYQVQLMAVKKAIGGIEVEG